MSVASPPRPGFVRDLPGFEESRRAEEELFRWAHRFAAEEVADRAFEAIADASPPDVDDGLDHYDLADSQLCRMGLDPDPNEQFHDGFRVSHYAGTGVGGSL